LERLKQKMQKTEWNRGYFRALYGMYLSRKKNSDTYALFSKLDLSDAEALHGYRREFLDHMRNGLHGDFDRGYFSAWSDCMRILRAIRAKPRLQIFYGKTKKHKVAKRLNWSCYDRVRQYEENRPRDEVYSYTHRHDF